MNILGVLSPSFQNTHHCTLCYVKHSWTVSYKVSFSVVEKKGPSKYLPILSHVNYWCEQAIHCSPNPISLLEIGSSWWEIRTVLHIVRLLSPQCSKSCVGCRSSPAHPLRAQLVLKVLCNVGKHGELYTLLASLGRGVGFGGWGGVTGCSINFGKKMTISFPYL